MSTGIDSRLLNSIWFVLSSPSATTVIKFLPRDSSLARLSYGLKNVRMDSFTFAVKPALPLWFDRGVNVIQTVIHVYNIHVSLCIDRLR